MKIEPVEITERALKQIEKIMHSKEIPEGYGLRIGIADQGISCGATRYILGFDNQQAGDISYRAGRLDVYIKKIEVVHLAGLTVDYISVDGNKGFSFERLPAGANHNAG